MIEDAHLIEEALKGKYKSFETIVGKYNPGVYRLAYLYTGNETEATQITQEVFVHALFSLRSFKNVTDIKIRLYKITTGLCLEKYRPNKGIGFFSRKRQPGSTAGVEVKNREMVPGAVKQENLLHMERIFHEMKLEHKYILILKDIMGVSHEDIGEIFNCSLHKAKQQISQARMTFNSKRKLMGLLMS